MISYSEILAESVAVGVSPETLEKDYHLDWYIVAMSREKSFAEFLFYGGTAIKKLYVPHHRFSEDLDWISSGRLTSESIQVALNRMHAFLEKEANLIYFFKPEEIQIQGTQTRFLIHYRGFSQTSGAKRFLLDFAQGIEELPRPEVPQLQSGYRDLKDRKIKVKAMPLEAICANKLALIVDRKRKEPRDIYDLWSILMRHKKFKRSIFLTYYRKALGYKTDFHVLESSLKDPEMRNAWQIRLKHQVANLPDFPVVLLELTGRLKEIFAEV